MAAEAAASGEPARQPLTCPHCQGAVDLQAGQLVAHQPNLGNIGQASNPFDQVGRELVLVVLEAHFAVGAELGQQALVDQAG